MEPKKPNPSDDPSDTAKGKPPQVPPGDQPPSLSDAFSASTNVPTEALDFVFQKQAADDAALIDLELTTGEAEKKRPPSDKVEGKDAPKAAAEPPPPPAAPKATPPPAAIPQGAPKPRPPAAPAVKAPPARPAGTRPGTPAPTPAPGKRATSPPVQPPPLPPPPPVTAEWKVLEPPDRGDAVEHEVCEFQPRDNGWAMLAASVRGKLHAHKAMWRDDAYRFGFVEDWTVIALADGAGSAPLSRVGARIACDEAVKAVGQGLTGFALAHPEDDLPTQAEHEQIRKILVESALRARAGIVLEADRRGCSPRDLHTTFLLLIHSPFRDSALVGTIQVGDGAIGVYTEDDACRLVGGADHGQYSSETCFLTTPNIDEQFGQRAQVAIFKKNIRCLAVMCDGVSDDFFPENKRLIELFNGNPVKELKTKQGDSVWGVLHKERGIVKEPRDGRALLDWLKYEKRGSSDDRTLVLMYRGEQP